MIKDKRLLALLLLAFILRVTVAFASDPYVERMFDIQSWLLDGEAVVQGQSPYIEVGSRANYPPLWYYLVGGLMLILGIGWQVVIPFKIIIALFDVGIVWFIWTILSREKAKKNIVIAAALIYALHPASLLVTGVQSQFDSISVFFILLAFYLLRYSSSWKWNEHVSALALGVGIAFKIFPVFVLPLLLLHKSTTMKLKYFILAAIPTGLAFLPYALTQTGIQAIIEHVLGYEPWVGNYGFILVVGELFGNSLLLTWLHAYQKYLLFATIILVAWLFKERDLFQGGFAVLLTFLFFTPGIGSQYFIWPLALSVLFWSWETAGYWILAGLEAITFFGGNFFKYYALPFIFITSETVTSLNTFVRFIAWLFIGYLLVRIYLSKSISKNTMNQ